MKMQTKKLTTIAMLCALAYVVMVICRIPIVLFLKYEPKDIIITIGGFIYGPMAAFAISAIVSVIEMLTVSDTGVLGLIMNVVATCSFACTASIIYKRNHTLKGAVVGLLVGGLLMTSVMLLWNYFIAPIYMGQPREAIVKLLLPAFLPFNLLKATLNATITLLIYKPVVTSLRRAGFAAPSQNASGRVGLNIGTILATVFLLICAVMVILVIRGFIRI